MERSLQHSRVEGEEERGERHKKMCWDYLLSQVMGAFSYGMAIHTIYHTVDLV